LFPFHKFSGFISPSSAVCVLHLTALTIIAYPLSVDAQQDRGSIAGVVTDISKATLQGARVEIAPETTPSGSASAAAASVPNRATPMQTATTNQGGDFIVSGLPPGRYTLKVSYLGFQPYTAEVDVTAGSITSVSPQLLLPTASESVTVQPEREVGEAEALNVQRTALNIVQVLPSEVINSLPNVNIADAIGRMPSVSVERDEGEAKYIQIRGTEPRLNSVTIDGIQVPSPENVRNVKLDTIPADLVESIQVNKTLTANMDGDGIGGSVNLVTRQATDEPYFAVEGLYGHTPINGGRRADQVFATYGRRFLADKKLGALITGSYDWNGRGINDIEPAQNVNNIVVVNPDGSTTSTGQTVNAPSAFDIRDYFYDRTRYGFGGSLDYKFNEKTTTYLKGLYSHFNDFGEDSINTLSVGNFISPTATDNSGNVVYSNVYRRPTQQIWSVSAGGQHDFGISTLNLRAALSQGSLTGGFDTFVFNGPAATTNAAGNPLQNGVGFTYSNRDIFLPKLTPVVTPGNVSIYDPVQYSLNNLSFQDNHTFERDAVGQADYARNYIRGSVVGTWQIGFKTRDVIKNQLYNQSLASGPNPPLSNFLTNRGQGNNYYFGQYQAGPQSKATSILAYYNANRGAFTVNPETASNLRNDWKVNERVYAGYAMNVLTLHRFRLYSGLRVEGTNEAVRGFEPDAANNTVPVNLSSSYTYLLPSASLQYNLGDYTDFRVAYSIALARPNYGDLAPYLTYNPAATDTAVNPALTAGNPNLKPTRGHNIDLLGEHYLKNIGVIQGGVFYKMLYNYIANSASTVQYQAPGTSAPARYYETVPLNIGAAHIIGFEASWEQHLTRLPGALSGTGFRANYSYTSSVAGLPGRSDHPSLQRTAPNNYNLDVTYDKYNISARMGITHNDAYLWSYAYQDGTPILGTPSTPTPGGIHGPLSDTYIYPHTQVDAQVSYEIPGGRGVSVVAQFLNLNNEVFGFYNGSEQYPIQREYYWPTYTFGLRWTQRAERGTVFRQ
jgi:TonB-dependent receptor